MISIASWNINSVRLRIDQVVRFAQEQQPDVLCLQEIKCQAHQFPAQALAELGYVHQAVHGQKGYHGVATASRVPFTEISRHDWQDNGEARHVGVELHGAGKGLILENVYIPAGGDIPDREANPKFGQKLDFIERMCRWAEAIDRPTLIVGDFNIAPLECDVYDHKALLKVVSHTPIEVERSAGSGTPTAGRTWAASSSLRPSATTRGGPTAASGGRRTRGGGSTISGPRPASRPRRAATASSRRRGAGSSRATTCRS
jgi:exodeoxyribonuclease III